MDGLSDISVKNLLKNFSFFEKLKIVKDDVALAKFRFEVRKPLASNPVLSTGHAQNWMHIVSRPSYPLRTASIVKFGGVFLRGRGGNVGLATL